MADHPGEGNRDNGCGDFGRQGSPGRDPPRRPGRVLASRPVQRKPDKIYVRDLGSRNGTFVNSEIVTLPRALEDGDVLKLGNTEILFGRAGAKAPAAETVVEAPSRPVLVVTGGPAAGRRIKLDELPIVLGREEAAGVAGLGDHFVSGRHLQISTAEAGGLIVEELGSMNGSRLNGTALVAGQISQLDPGDELRLGPETVLRLERP